MWIKNAWLPCSRLTGQQAMKHTSKKVHAGFETQGRHHKKSKTGVSVAPKEELMSPILPPVGFPACITCQMTRGGGGGVLHPVEVSK